jgi:hypothetical protein
VVEHPVDHPDDPTGPVWIHLDRRPIQPEQARSAGADQIDAEHRLRIWRLGFESLAARTISARWRGHVSGWPGWIAVASTPSGELSGALSRPVARRSQGSTVTALATATSSSLSHNGRCA